MTRTKSLTDIIKDKKSWAEQIARGDSTFIDYAGAPIEIGEQLAILDTFTDLIIPPGHPLHFLLSFRRAHLINLTKAWFAGEKTGEISQLGFRMAGVKRNIGTSKPTWRRKLK